MKASVAANKKAQGFKIGDRIKSISGEYGQMVVTWVSKGSTRGDQLLSVNDEPSNVRLAELYVLEAERDLHSFTEIVRRSSIGQ